MQSEVSNVKLSRSQRRRQQREEKSRQVIHEPAKQSRQIRRRRKRKTKKLTIRLRNAMKKAEETLNDTCYIQVPFHCGVMTLFLRS